MCLGLETYSTASTFGSGVKIHQCNVIAMIKGSRVDDAAIAGGRENRASESGRGKR